MTDSSPSLRTSPDGGPRLAAARWVLAVTVVGSALALGSLHTTVLCIVVAALAVAAFLAWHKAEPYRARPAATLLLFTGVGLTLWTLIQSIPMPASWLAVIAPANADVWARALTPLKEPGPEWVTISLDPGATRVQVLRGVGYLCAFLCALRVAHRREGSVFLERVIVVSAAIMAMAALLHPAFGATKVFGVYQPVNTLAFMPNHIGPLLNLNHLVAYLNLGVCVALAGVITTPPLMPRVLGGALVALLVAVGLWSGSRGGVGSLICGSLLVVIGSRAATTPTRRLGSTLAVVMGLLGFALAVLSVSSEGLNDLKSTDISKLLLQKQVLAMVRVFPLVGIGRGAFESAFPAFRQGIGYWVFTHPENVVMQFLSEWGVMIGGAALGAIGYALRPASVLARSRPPIGAWAALAGFALHNVVDFNCEVPGVTIAACLCAAIVVAGGGGVTARTIGGWSSRPRVVSIAVVAGVAGALALALPSIGHGLNDEQFAQHDRALDPAVSRAEFVADLRATILRHPADPYFPFVGAVRAARARDESVVPWVGRALDRSPVLGRAHLLLARWLVTISPSQARLEYRLAMQQDSQLVMTTELPPLARGYDDAMELVPSGAAGPVVLEALVTALEDRLPASCVRLDVELAQRKADGVAPLVRAVERTIDDLAAEESSPWCVTDRKACADAALAQIHHVAERSPNTCAAPMLKARCRIQLGETRAALNEFEAEADRVADRGECQRKLLGLALEANDDARVTLAVDRLSKLGCGTTDECGALFSFLASVEEGRGNQRRALSLYKQGADRSPDRDDFVASVARVASSLGLHAEALEAYQQLARRQPDVGKWAAGAAAERAALAGGGAVRGK